MNTVPSPNCSLSPSSVRQAQREFFNSGITHSLDFRKNMLTMLAKEIQKEEQAFVKALATDLGKSEFDAYTNEIGLVYAEIKHTIRHLKSWARPRAVASDLALLPGRARIHSEPYGSVLILAPWNYPMQLLFMPLVGAIAAGNCVVLKPSELAPNTAQISARLINSCFSSEYICVLQGGADTASELIDQDFDYLFFTGSVAVGKKIMAQASRFLTPMTLELGGKSPVLVEKSADVDHAAKKIVWGKFINAGQTCVAPDYVLADHTIVEQLVHRMKDYITRFYGTDPQQSPDYGRIISDRHFDRLTSMLDETPEGKQVPRDKNARYIHPCILYPTSTESELMKDEIFGPILPVFSFESTEDAINTIRSRPKPLAMYVFSQNNRLTRHIVDSISFGGGAVNTTIMHVASHRLPFGGVGPSGMGSYHGQASFNAFSHKKSMLYQPTKPDPGLVYPNKRISLAWIRRLL